ncbi:MAG: aminotransferase class IV [Acidimicrobiales bacterium]
MHDQGLVWRNGELIPFADATCHVLSHMAARGSQIFDVMLVTWTDDGPCAVGLRHHVARFLRSAELMGMEEVGEVGAIERAIAETVIANSELVASGAADAADQAPRACMVKMVAAWTEQPVGIMPAVLRPTVYLLVLPIGDAVGPAVVRAPVSVRSSTVPKMPAEILPPSMKVAAGYTPGVRAQMLARAEGFDYTVFKTIAGDLAESTTLSMLVVQAGRLLAPPLDSVRDGITRRAVLDAAQAGGIPVEVRSIWWDEVEAADELILSSTTNPVVPVGRLDQRLLDAPGPITGTIGRTLVEVYAGGHRLSTTWLTPLQGLT